MNIIHYLLVTFIFVMACLLPLPAQAETIEEKRAKAEKGDVNAQFFLGAAYSIGNGGLVENEKEAVKWYRKAAEQGHALSQYNLGSRYYEGSGVVKNDVEAVKWFRKAADQGITAAQSRLGVLYFKGYGVKKNDLLAYQWCLVASANGSIDARDSLSAIEEKLTAEQRAEVQRLATEWQEAFEKKKAEAK
jgi:TPR repeat protein